MEVDRVADWREWPDDWHGEHSNEGETEEEHHDEKGGDEAYVHYIGKGGGKKGGKGFQGYCYICGDSDTRSGIATRAKGKEKVSARTVGVEKVMARMYTQARRTAKERDAMADENVTTNEREIKNDWGFPSTTWTIASLAMSSTG